MSQIRNGEISFSYLCIVLSFTAYIADGNLRLHTLQNIEINKALEYSDNISDVLMSQFSQFFKTTETDAIEIDEFKQELGAQKISIERLVPYLNQKIQKGVKYALKAECRTNFEDPTQKLMTQIDGIFNCAQHCTNEKYPRNCEWAMPGPYFKSGVYTIKVERKGSQLNPFFAYCKKVDGKVWTLIQRREDKSENFRRNWNDYKNGFGMLYGDFWLGLQRIYELTRQYPHELFIWLERTDGTTAYANYRTFSIENADQKYKLKIGEYSGTADDELTQFNDVMFSTFDSNNNPGILKGDCCSNLDGGWWFIDCKNSLLNSKDGPNWGAFGENLKHVSMGIRQV